jgi:ureidoglycolate dehydrogenase (NAD+)
MSTPSKQLVSPDALTSFAAALFERAGAPEEHAAAIAEVLVWASVRGIDSHGVTRIAPYVELLQQGVANPRPDIRVRGDAPGVAVIEADHAAGPVALREAVDLAVDTARVTGVAAVGVERSVHTGAIGYYTNRIAGAGMVGVAFVAGMPNMGYLGVKGKAVATSPLSIAVPGRRHATVLLDMATATIALGKIRQHKASGAPLPEGAAATADGTPTTDPALAEMPLPLGGAKGSGMSLLFELITSVLVGAPIVESFHGGGSDAKRHRQNALVIALDPAAFGDADEFRDHVDATVDALKALPVAEGAEGIFVPGERSSGVAARRSAEGVPIAPKVWSSLEAVAAELGTPMPVPIHS